MTTWLEQAQRFADGAERAMMAGKREAAVEMARVSAECLTIHRSLERGRKALSQIDRMSRYVPSPIVKDKPA